MNKKDKNIISRLKNFYTNNKEILSTPRNDSVSILQPDLETPCNFKREPKFFENIQKDLTYSNSNKNREAYLCLKR